MDKFRENLLNQLGDRSHLGLDSDVEPRHFDPAPVSNAWLLGWYNTVFLSKKLGHFLNIPSGKILKKLFLISMPW